MVCGKVSCIGYDYSLETGRRNVYPDVTEATTATRPKRNPAGPAFAAP